MPIAFTLKLSNNWARDHESFPLLIQPRHFAIALIRAPSPRCTCGQRRPQNVECMYEANEQLCKGLFYYSTVVSHIAPENV